MYWGARALGGQVYSEYIGSDPTASAQSHLEVLPQNYSVHISWDVPEISFVSKQAWKGLQSQYNVFPVPFSTFHIHVILDHSPAGHGSDC